MQHLSFHPGHEHASRRSSLAALLAHPGFLIRQRTEGLELIGCEGANSYDILDWNGRRAFFARERLGGFWQQFSRQFGGHTVNAFVVDVFDEAGRPVLTLSHPSSWWMQRIEVYSGHGRYLGSFEQCFTWLNKKMLIKGADGRPRMEMDSQFLSPWQHSFSRTTAPHPPVQLARVEKQWEGVLRELFTDADTFRLTYESGACDVEDRALLLGAALFIDLVWFEHNANK